MNKSTIVRFLFLVVACLVIIPMVIACGDDTTDNSTPTTESTPSSVPSTENSVPSTENSQPSTENSQPSTEDSTPAAGDNKITIFYDPGQGGFADLNDYEHKIDKGSRYQGHPTPEWEGYVFEGWFTDEACKTPVKTATKYETDVTLYAKWRAMFKCTDGTYDHNFGQYEPYTDPDCTKPGTKVRYCTYCQGTDIVEGDPAQGHNFTPWTDGFLSRKRTCQRPGCGEVESIQFENITLDTLGSNPQAQFSISGGYYSYANPVQYLYNKVWDEEQSTTLASNGQGDLIVTIRLVEATQIDRIYMKGRGGGGVEIHVQYEGDATFTNEGPVSFLSGAENSKPLEEKNIPYVEVDTTRNVVAVKIVQQAPPNGTSLWEEIAFVKVVTEND